MRVAVTEPGHPDAASKVEEFAAVAGVEPAAFAMIDGDVPPAVGRHNGCNHGISPAREGLGNRVGDRKLSPPPNPPRPGPAAPPPIPAQVAGTPHHGPSPRRGGPARRPA